MNLLLYCFLNLFLITFCVLIQVSVIQPLPQFFFDINLVYITILCLLFFNRTYLFISWVIIGGFLWDYFSSFPFGLMLLVLLLVVSIMYTLMLKVFSNRSVYAFFVSLTVGVLIYNVILWLLAFILRIFWNMNLSFGIRELFFLTLKQSIFIIFTGSIIWVAIGLIKKNKDFINKTTV